MNASPWEIIQVLVALTGFLFSIKPKINADRNHNAAMTDPRGEDRILFTKWLCTKTSTTLWIQLMFFLGGLTLCFLAPPPWALEILAATNPGTVDRRLLREAQVSMIVTRLILGIASVALMRLSYQSWIMLPRFGRRHRREDGMEATNGNVGKTLQDGAQIPRPEGDRRSNT
jgi:hypothetical protein